MPKRARGVPPRVTKGGDGGRPVSTHARHGASYYHDTDNQVLVLVGRDIGRGLGKRLRRLVRAELEAVLVATADPFDCAHADRHQDGRYLAQAGPRGLPRDGLFDHRRRGYPPALMVGRPGEAVSIDSQWDAAAERERRLGVRLGVSAEAASCSAVIERLVVQHGRDRVRSIVQQQTTQDMTPAELALECAASAMLGEAGS